MTQLGGGDDPQLSVVGSRLIINYSTFSDILVYDLQTLTYQVYKLTSDLYSSRKTYSQKYAEEVDTGELLDELFKFWERQIRYGPIPTWRTAIDF